MSTRPVISYDDITLPYDQPEPKQLAQHSPPNRPPPSKKRKWANNQKAKQRPQHWDDPTRPQDSAYYGRNEVSVSKQKDDDEEMYDEGTGENDEESRQLSYDEIWDDSALINAWDAAMEEYEAYNGPDKGWKKEPVNKSPLWYNVPPAGTNLPVPSSKKSDVQNPTSSSAPSALPSELDSQPLNFDTFVPTHDPSLDVELPAPTENYAPTTQADAMVSQDEAFSRALNAMYWGGYWTAIYQSHRHRAQSSPTDGGGDENEDGEQGNEADEGQEEDEFVSTQR